MEEGDDRPLRLIMGGDRKIGPEASALDKVRIFKDYFAPISIESDRSRGRHCQALVLVHHQAHLSLSSLAFLSTTILPKVSFFYPQ